MGKRRRSKRRGPNDRAEKNPPLRPSVAKRVPRDRFEAGLWALGLSVLAAAHRIFFLLSDNYSDWPFSVFYEGDSEAFFRWARAILAGETYDLGLPFHPPGFAYFLAGLHQLLGAGHGIAEIPHLYVRVTLALLGGVTVGLLFLLVRPYLGPLCALLTGVFATYHFGFYILSVSPVTEVLYLFLLMIALLIFSRGLDHPLSAAESPGHQHWAGLALGCVLGAMALTRAESQLLAVLILGVGVFGLWRTRSLRWKPWALLVLGWILVVSPWTLENRRNLVELNNQLADGLAEPLPTLVPLTIYGPLNLALANHDQADGTFSRDLMSSQKFAGNLDLEDPQHLEFILHGDRMAGRWIIAHPAGFARLVGKRWWLATQSWRLGFTQWNWPGGWVGLRRAVDIYAPDSMAGLVLLPLALLGWVFAFRTGGRPRRFAELVLLPTIVVLTSTGLFFGYVRQGLLVMPFGLAFLAVGLVLVGQRITKSSASTLFEAVPSKRFLGTLAVIVCVLLVVEWRGSKADRHFKASGETVGGSQKLNRDLPVRLEPLP